MNICTRETAYARDMVVTRIGNHYYRSDDHAMEHYNPLASAGFYTAKALWLVAAPVGICLDLAIGFCTIGALTPWFSTGAALRDGHNKYRYGMGVSPRKRKEAEKRGLHGKQTKAKNILENRISMESDEKRRADLRRQFAERRWSTDPDSYLPAQDQ